MKYLLISLLDDFQILNLYVLNLENQSLQLHSLVMLTYAFLYVEYPKILILLIY